MKTVLLTLSLFLFCFRISAQQVYDPHVVVTIEKRTSSKLHTLAFDYWIISEAMWREGEQFLPLYIDGFSKTDMDECCLSDTLVLFNTSSEESFNFEESYKKSTENLHSLVLVNRRKVLSVKKKGKGYKEQITVYLSPIKGIFCVCEVRQSKGNSNLGYYGRVSIPQGGFMKNEVFWESDVFNGMAKFDYMTLPFLCLQNIQ